MKVGRVECVTRPNQEINQSSRVDMDRNFSLCPQANVDLGVALIDELGSSPNPVSISRPATSLHGRPGGHITRQSLSGLIPCKRTVGQQITSKLDT